MSDEPKSGDQAANTENAAAWDAANRRETERRERTQDDMGNLAGPKTQRAAPAKEES